MVAAYAWLSGGEIPSQRLRSYTFGIASAVGFLGAWLATFTAPYFINPESLNWGPEYGTLHLPTPFSLLTHLTPSSSLYPPFFHNVVYHANKYQRLDLGPILFHHRRMGILLPP
jgi:hypothetical protein